MNTLLRLGLNNTRMRLGTRQCKTLLVVDHSRAYSDDSEDKKAKSQDTLASLLSNLKTTGTVKKSKEPALAKPKRRQPIKREKDGIPKQASVDISNLDPEVVAASKAVADIAKTQSKKRRTESDLLKKLKGITEESDTAKLTDVVAGETEPTPGVNISDLLSNVKIEKQEKSVVSKTADIQKSKQDKMKELTMEQLAFLQKRQKLRRQEQSKTQQYTPIHIWGGTPLGIFTEPVLEKHEDDQVLNMWRRCRERELRILSTPSPRNALEEMILWTEQEKLWQFPVDNEQGLDYSDDAFYNHVFLEQHLEPWCPKSGPVRHFMELVCIGLSKNPYLSSDKKYDTIIWFKNYFEREDNLEILVHGGFWEEQLAASE